MSFFVFDAIDSISHCNSFFFGFHCFTRDFFKTLQQGFDVYKNSRFYNTGVNIDRITLRECFELPRNFYQREKDVTFLQQKETWELFRSSGKPNVVVQQQLAEIQANFQRQERFAIHTNESLLEAYRNLTQIKSVLRLALKDVKKAQKRWIFGKIPKELLTRYHNYLIQQLAILKQEREDIVMHMLGRLIQASLDPFLENTDTLPDIIQYLKTKGFLKSTYNVPTLSDNKLTKALFYIFHRIIEKKGNSEIHSALRSLPWFKNSTTLAARFRVSHLVPASKKRPAFLFYNHNLRYHWFEDFHAQAKIDATLRYLRAGHVSGELNVESLSQRIVSVYSAEKALRYEKHRVQKARGECRKGLRKYFNHETLRFLDEIELSHRKLERKLLDEKIELLRFISAAPIEAVQSLHIVKFLDSFDPDLCEKTHAKFRHYQQQLRKRLEIFMEEHLQHYFCQWSSCSHVKELDALNHDADAQEQLLFRVLPEAWAERVRRIRLLRTGNRWASVESAAQLNLKHLIIEKPIIIQKLVKNEFQVLRENLVQYLRNTIQDFDYDDQRNALFKMVEDLADEKDCEAEKSTKLDACERQFLKSFPEVNFFINVMLRLKQEERLLEKIYNPKEIEARIEAIHRFIRRQEASFLSKSKTPFSTLFYKPEQPSVERVLIHQLKRAII